MRNSNKYIAGAIAGFFAGLVFGMMMAFMGMMPMVAKLVGSDSEVVGWGIHLFISIAIGIFYVWWFSNLASTMKKSILFGGIHGIIWWILGALTIMPLMLGMPVQYSKALEEMNLMSLFGHIIYGFILGFMYFILYKRSD